MGDYAAVIDVERKLNLDFTDATKVTTAEVETFIANREHLINGILRAQGYQTVPVTDEGDVEMLRGLVEAAAAADVYESWYVRPQLPERQKNWREDFDKFINMLRQGQIHLANQMESDDAGDAFLVFRRVIRDR